MSNALVLDTNILLRAVFGVKVPRTLAQYQEKVDFFTPEFCYEELTRHAYRIGKDKELSLKHITHSINSLEQIVCSISLDVYGDRETDAKNRIHERDINDWPIVALALTLNCAIWTEDKDFFGIGLSTWNSRNVEIFLSSV